MASETQDTKQYYPDTHVAFTKLDETEGVLLHLSTKQYYTLNETGLFIWDHLEHGHDVDQIASALTEIYEVTIDDARSYAGEFLAELHQEGLVTDEKPEE